MWGGYISRNPITTGGEPFFSQQSFFCMFSAPRSERDRGVLSLFVGMPGDLPENVVSVT